MLPIPPLVEHAPQAAAHWVVTPLDRDGRLADRSVLTLMSWPAGQTVGLTIEPGPIVIARAGGSVRVNQRGHLRVPLAVRRRCGIVAGDRMLVAGDRRRGEVLLIPMTVLHDMVGAFRQLRGGGAGDD